MEVSFDAVAEDTKSMVVLEGKPGTVTPSDAKVIVTNLDNVDAPSVAAVASDGSFSIAVAGYTTNTFRFQVATDDGQRTEPVDLVIDAAIGVTAPVTSLECLKFEPRLWLDLDLPNLQGNVVLRSECDVAVEMAAPQLRRGLAGLSVTPTGAVTLAPGDQVFLNISASDFSDEPEDVLFLTPLGSSAFAITVTRPDSN